SGGGYVDGLATSAFSMQGSQASVSAALQFVAAHPPQRRSRVAIVDGGFWLDSDGHPRSTPGGLSDLPDAPMRWDFLGTGAVADGENPSGCAGGSLCRWHGNDSASVATARLDNKYGAAGNGGTVADPILYKTGADFGSAGAAIRAASGWGADVVSMSFGAEC